MLARRLLVTLLLSVAIVCTSCATPAAADPLPKTTQVHYRTVATTAPSMTYPYAPAEVRLAWNARHAAKMTGSQAFYAAAWLNAIVRARVLAYLVAVANAQSQDPRTAARNAAIEFGIPVDAFMRVIDCESHFNPGAVNSSSGALGLGQHLPSYWGGRAAQLGYSYGDWSNARANARVSAKLWRDSGPQNWVCY